jgi:HAD superfamily hydrolase (TIGR01509 family)
MTLVIFDCDGVLVDSEILFNRIAAEQFTEYGYPIDTETAIARFTGLSTPTMVGIVEAELGRAIPDDFGERCRARANTVFDEELQAVDGIDAVLAANAPRRCVASSSSPLRIRRSLKSTGLYRHFNDAAIFSAAMVERGKPAPDLFLHAASEMAAAPADCIVIEDSLPGVDAAVAAGMTVLGFVGASHIRDGHAATLRDRGAARTFDNMAMLPALLDEPLG